MGLQKVVDFTILTCDLKCFLSPILMKILTTDIILCIDKKLNASYPFVRVSEFGNSITALHEVNTARISSCVPSITPFACNLTKAITPVLIGGVKICL